MSDKEHRELLSRVNADDVIRRIRFHIKELICGTRSIKLGLEQIFIPYDY